MAIAHFTTGFGGREVRYSRLDLVLTPSAVRRGTNLAQRGWSGGPAETVIRDCGRRRRRLGRPIEHPRRITRGGLLTGSTWRPCRLRADTLPVARLCQSTAGSGWTPGSCGRTHRAVLVSAVLPAIGGGSAYLREARSRARWRRALAAASRAPISGRCPGADGSGRRRGHREVPAAESEMPELIGPRFPADRGDRIRRASRVSLRSQATATRMRSSMVSPSRP